jgi:hypothetical protein
MRAVGDVLGRDFTVFRQKADEAESVWVSDICRADDASLPCLAHCATIT